MAGHTTLAKMQKMGPGVIEALRAGTSLPDARQEALHCFATLVVRNRGWMSEDDGDVFLAAGFTRRNVLGIATKVMSNYTNYTNHIVHTPLEAFMKGNEWSKPPVDAV